MLLSHYVWFKFFYQNYTPIFQVTGFFLLMIWATPILFFVSLSMGDDALPIGSQGHMVGGKNIKGKNVFRNVCDWFMEHYNNYVSKSAPGLRKHY